jgi:hypothetical protein
MAAIAISIPVPKLVVPFSHGVGPEGYRFMRALYGLAVSGAIGVAVSFFTKPRPENEITGLICSRALRSR